MANNKVLRLDITKTPDLVPTIYGRVADGLVQTVDVYATNNGEPFDITGWTIKFEGNTSGNRTFIADSENVKIVNAKGGFFQYTFPLPAFANSGKYERAYFSFALDEKHESSNNFNIQVFENADITVEEAHTVITEYEKLVDELNKIFIEAQEDLTNDVEEYKQWLTQQVQELQNKIDILNTRYTEAEDRISELEARIAQLVNDGLLKMEDVIKFLQGDTTVTVGDQNISISDIMPTFAHLKETYYNKKEINDKLNSLDKYALNVAEDLPEGITSLVDLAMLGGRTFYITDSQLNSMTDKSDVPESIKKGKPFIVENKPSKDGTYRVQIIYSADVSTPYRYSRMILKGNGKSPFERIVKEPKYGLLETKGLVISSQDWNEVTTTGIYKVYNATGNHKPSIATYGTLEVVSDGSTVTQVYKGSSKIAIRTRAGSPAVWKDWSILANQSDLDNLNNKLNSANGRINTLNTDLTATKKELENAESELATLKNKKVRWEGWFGDGAMVNPIRDKSRLSWGALKYTKGQVDNIPMDDNPFELSRLYFKAKRDVTFFIEGTLRAQGVYDDKTSRYAYWHLRINTDLSETTGTAIHVGSTNGQNNGRLQWKNFTPFSRIISMKAGESMAMSVDLEAGKVLLQADINTVHVKCLN